MTSHKASKTATKTKGGPRTHGRFQQALDAAARREIEAALKETGGNVSEAARVLDLRHAHASLWLMAGGSLADVQRNLGHSSPVLTSETYGHIGEDHRIREVDERLALGIGRPGLKPLPTESPATMAEGA